MKLLEEVLPKASGAADPRIPTSQSASSALSQLPLKEGEDGVHLQRNVGLLSGVALIIGTMIGSGIFVSPKGVLLRAGSVGLSLVVWAGCGLLCHLGALCYGELGTAITKSGAEYSYLLDAFGPLPAFLFSWVSVLVLKPSMLAIICMSLGEYVVEPLGIGCETDQNLVKLVTAISICVITLINCYGVQLATEVQNLFTCAKLLAIIVIVIGGMVQIMQGRVEHLATGFQGSSYSFSDIATAFYSGLWAYDGWNNLNYVTEEIIDPSRNLPLAITIAIPVVSLCYIAVNISYMTAMSTADILSSEAVAVTWGRRVLGPLGIIMPISVVLSSFGAGNGSCFTGGRLSYVAAREGHLLDILSYVHVKRLTPSPALIFNAIVALCMVVLGDITRLIDFFSFTAWLTYGATMLALVVLRWTKPDLHRPYKVNLIIPFIVLLVSIYLVIGPIVEEPQIEYLYSSLFIFSGLVFYVPFVHFRLNVPAIGRITRFFQLLLEVVPSSYPPD